MKECADERIRVLKAAKKEAEQALALLNSSYEKLKKDYVMEFGLMYMQCRDILNTYIRRTEEISNGITRE